MQKFLSLFLSLLSFSALAATETNPTDSIHNTVNIDEVSVKSFKQTEKNFSAVSSSIVGGLQLKNYETTNIKDLSALLPNFFMPDYGSKQSSPVFVRGIGSKLYASPIGLYIDGVPHFEKSAFDFDLAEVISVELLRGPQGTLYGRNTAGGILNITTPSPLDQQYTRLKLSYATANEIEATASTYNKLGKKVGLSLMANYRHHDGYFENKTSGENADRLESLLTRMSLVYKPNSNWTLRLNGTYDYTDQNGYPYGLYDADKDEVAAVNYDYPSTYLREIITAGFNANYTGKKISFNSQTSFQQISDNQKIDQDFSPISSLYVNQKTDQTQFSQELTIKSTTSSRYQHITGLFTFWQENNKHVDTQYLERDLGLEKSYYTPTMGVALYHQSSYEIAKGFTALVGLRLDSEFAGQKYKSYTNSLTTTDNRKETLALDNYQIFNQLTPKFTLKYEFTPEKMVYGSITRGYKAGGFNTTFESEEDHAYNPEYNWNYEIGTKQSYLDGKLTTDLALFYIDWRDQQVGQIISGVGNIMRNAGHSMSRGVEVSINTRPIQNVNITASYGFTDAKYLEFENGGIDYSGKYLILVPRHTASLQTSYTFYDLTPTLNRLMFSAGLTGAGKIYWEDSNNFKQDFYTTLTAKISAQLSQRYTLELWGRNLTDSNYVTYMFSMFDDQFAQRCKPRTLGCSLIYKF